MPEALPLAAFVNEVIDARVLTNDTERRVHALEIGDDITLGVDRAHLHQILDNLLANARRYCSGQPGSVRLRATRAGSCNVRAQAPAIAGQWNRMVVNRTYRAR